MHSSRQKSKTRSVVFAGIVVPRYVCSVVGFNSLRSFRPRRFKRAQDTPTLRTTDTGSSGFRRQGIGVLKMILQLRSLPTYAYTAVHLVGSVHLKANIETLRWSMMSAAKACSSPGKKSTACSTKHVVVPEFLSQKPRHYRPATRTLPESKHH